ncbi:VOC family protein, partial [Bacillus spizizenii]|nr:VOC family protein [Bacillus spizizenii]
MGQITLFLIVIVTGKIKTNPYFILNCGHPQENVGFYAGVLGLRLVKQTVNFDDPGTYHLYFS